MSKKEVATAPAEAPVEATAEKKPVKAEKSELPTGDSVTVRATVGGKVQTRVYTKASNGPEFRTVAKNFKEAHDGEYL